MDSVRDWLGNLTTFRYDEDNNLLTRTFPDATHVTDALSYDNASRLMGITDAKSGATFASFGYGRDSANQLTSTTSSGVPTDNNAYTYTRLNQLASVNGAAYGYDAADNLSRVTSGVVQAYDAANQLCWTGSGSGSCASPPASATAYSYDGLGDRVGRRGPVTATQYGYDQARRLTSVGMLGTLAGGELDSLAVRSDGTVVASGLNTSGQLGTGSGAKTTLTPAVVPGLTGVAAVAAGWYHSEALLGDGTIRAWGYNADGEVGNGSTADVTTPVSIGLSNIAAIAAGAFHTLALGQDGSVKAWGDNSSGQLGNGTTTRATAPTPIGLTGVTAVAAGTGHSLALKGDGTVLAWGANARGQLGNGSTAPSTAPVAVAGLSGVRAIAAGGAHSMALKSDGTVWDWGPNSFGELGNGGGPDATAPVRVAGLSGIVAIAAGTNHALALQANGTAWAWGFNGDGELGTGTVANAAAPVRVSGLGAVSAVAAGGAHSLAATADGAVWAWGYNPDGQVGNGTTSRATAPVRFGSTTTAAGGSYLYNADGLRMAKTAAGGARAFAWDLSGGPPSLLVEGAGSAATKYVYGPGGLPLEQVDPAGAVVYYHPDQLGSTRALTDAAGAVVGTSTYDSYGKLVGQAGSKTTPFGFACEYSDAETGLVYLRARYYDPATGQFVSRDPLVALTRSAYGYVGGNPLNFTDPSGLLTLKGFLKGAALGLGAAALIIGTAGIATPELAVLGVGAASASTGLATVSTVASIGVAAIDCNRRRNLECVGDVAEAAGGAFTTAFGIQAITEGRAALRFGNNLLGFIFDAAAFVEFDPCDSTVGQRLNNGARL